jgi:hypothetical protein
MKNKKNLNWNMIFEDGKLFILKGADEIFYLDEVSREAAEILYNAYLQEDFDNIENIEIVQKLEHAGVIYKEIFEHKKPFKFGIKYLGTPIEMLSSILTQKSEFAEENPDLLLLIRTNKTLKQSLDEYETLFVPHLFVDLAYSNIISIAPLIYKNHTACLGCYIGRLTKNWGDPEPPIEPCATYKIDLISAFITEKLNEYAKFGNCPDLINNVWNFNIKTFEAKYNAIYRLPWCPICGIQPENKHIDLPWGEI